MGIKILSSLWLFATLVVVAQPSAAPVCKELGRGVKILSVGTPDTHTPMGYAPEPPRWEAINRMDEGALPFDLSSIEIEVTRRGTQISVPLGKDEQLYGFGMQISSFGQRGLKRKPIVNDVPSNMLGYTHAPQPFYVSTAGYGILVNTFRYSTFLCGTNSRVQGAKRLQAADGTVSTEVEDLYRDRHHGECVHIDVPNTDGVELIVITGKDLRDVVRKYNLLSGGGCMPPLWGLGLKYRTKTDFTQEGVERIASYFREKEIPCDVVGLEPGWHTNAYSCSYVWNKDRFPNHRAMIDSLHRLHFRVNLWEHAYVHPTSPIYESIKPYSGDFLVWQGLVPDFATPQARQQFTALHSQLADEGISGFKLDECDNSNVTDGRANWGFPDLSRFPSGMDGEQMHQALGQLYLNTLNEMYKSRNRRTYQDYRASGLFVSSIPATLYSDIYGHKDYIEMICSSAFGGLLWSPEVRRSDSEYDFFHRFQTVLLSAQAVSNSWFLENPPWLQFDKEKNNRNEFLPNVEEMEGKVRTLIGLRMQLIPYLYNAFFEYASEGTPPFRPLLMDYPDDKRLRTLCDQYMVGSSLMAAPLQGDTHRRKVYFPKGIWYNFNTHERYEGGQEIEVEVPFDQLPLFVKEGTLLPLAKPEQSVRDNTVFELTLRAYGSNPRPALLVEDDGVSYDYLRGKYNRVTIGLERGKPVIKRTGNYTPLRYVLTKSGKKTPVVEIYR